MGAASPRPCVACGGPMELGTLLDRTYSATGHARVNPVAFGGAQTRQREVRLVVAYRCGSCGRLDLYADGVVQRAGVPERWKDPPPFE